MIELKGKYNTAYVYTDIFEPSAVTQIIELCSQEFTSNEKIRIMPDVHSGVGCTVGTTMTITDKIVPNLVGVDIGCGMETVIIKEDKIDYEMLDNVIHEKIPAGARVRKKIHPFAEKAEIEKLYCIKHIDYSNAMKSIGSLGGGNHFIEADKDDEGNIYIVVHSGSRHLGLEVAKYYQKQAYNQLNGCLDEDIKKRLRSVDKKNAEKEIKKIKSVKISNVPSHLSYVSGKLFDEYIHDMKIVQNFALLNRKAIIDVILSEMDLNAKESFSTIHNYIDTDRMILRKGAVSAEKDEKLIIPINMRDGSLICVGKGNANWNYSAPHGAGRIMSRGEARESIALEDFKKSMSGIYSTSVSKRTLDESPFAYKPMQSIIDNISETAEVKKIIKPVYNFKAGC